MHLTDNQLESLQRQTDRLYALWPRTVPARDLLKNCRLIAHRGDHDQFIAGAEEARLETYCRENTLDAFERCRAAGVFGIECDIQWSCDSVPMIIHDPDAGRVFNQPQVSINQFTHAQLTQECPQIPSLADVVNQYCPDLHLMLEIKQDTWQPSLEAVLYEHLSHLRGGVDYHLLCLDMSILDQLRLFDPSCFIGVALTNTRAVFNHVIASSWAAMSGHYVLLNKSMRKQLKAQGKRIGTGFIESRRALFREVNLGTQWIFSNQAVALQKDLNQLVKNKGS